MSAGTLIGGITHSEALLSAMGGSPDGWSYTGIVTDAGSAGSKCACGHSIRYEYHWEHTSGRKLITGSVCVEHLPFVNAATLDSMKADLDALIKRQREDRRKAEQAAQSAEVAALRAKLLGDIDRVYHRAASWPGGWMPGDVFDEHCRRRELRGIVYKAGTLKTAKGQLRKLQDLANTLATSPYYRRFQAA
jgi:hypothetical protein